EWEIEEGLDFQIPPLSIQPLVENAVEHGVLKRMEGGKICIRITRHLNHYQIAVIDNGIGMGRERAEQLLKEHPSVASGVGVANTHHRLKRLYGKGLTIESKIGQGTTVRFEIPRDQ